MVHQGCVKGAIYPIVQRPYEAPEPVRPANPRTCVVCGAELGYRKKKYCSDACMREDSMRRQRIGKGLNPERTCVVCGNVMPPRHKRYCSDACRLHADRERRLARRGAATS